MIAICYLELAQWYEYFLKKQTHLLLIFLSWSIEYPEFRVITNYEQCFGVLCDDVKGRKTSAIHKKCGVLVFVLPFLQIVYRVMVILPAGSFFKNPASQIT